LNDSQENFYEFLLSDGQGLTINDQMIQNQIADLVDPNEIPACLSYPSFNMLEKLVIYPSFEERCNLQQCYAVNFNEFEEKNISRLTNALAFENELWKLLNEEKFFAIKRAFDYLHPST
jgi:hypothetical protein